MTFFSQLHPDLLNKFKTANPQFQTISEMVKSRTFTHFSHLNIQGGNAHVSEQLIDVDGHSIRVIICKPNEQFEKSSCIIWYHGGGMVLGTPDDSVIYMLDFVQQLKAVVVIPEYRLAPEYPYPAGLHDCYHTLQWVEQNADQLNINPKKIIVAGGSAGGNLCVAVSLMARDKNSPSIAFQLPLYPMLDYQNNQPSNLNITSPLVWNYAKNAEAWEMYLQHVDIVDEYASPTYAQNYEGLPPTYTFVGTIDLFRDEVIAFVQRLAIANVPVEFHLYNGCTHGFDLEDSPIGQQAKRELLFITRQYLERYEGKSNV